MIIPREDSPASPWQLENVPRVTLSRYSNQPVADQGYFHSGRVSYREDAGLFFLYKTEDIDIERKFKAALRLLADEGIGGDRTCGNGLMDIPEFDEIEINCPVNTDGELTLSTYFPDLDNEEVDNLTSGYYEFLDRKGYIYSPDGQNIRRKSVRMFSEGSVFPKNDNRTGVLTNVAPTEFFSAHKVYRYGLFFSLPCRMEVI